MGVLGELGGSSRVVIDLPKGHAWFGAGGEARLQVLRVFKRRNVWMAWPSSMLDALWARGMQRENAGLPCQDGFV